MGVSHENCVGDFCGRVIVFRVLLTMTHNETQQDTMRHNGCVRVSLAKQVETDEDTNFSSDYTDNIDNWVICHFYCFKEKQEKNYYEFLIFLNDWNPCQMNKHDGSC